MLDLAGRCDRPALLAGQSVGLYFEKPSLRTRHSCEMAVVQLGGHPVTIRADEVGIGTREPLTDIARVLSGYHAALGGRVFDHGDARGAGRARRPSRSSTCSPTTPIPARPWPTCSRCAQRLRRPRRPHGRLDRRLQQRGPEPRPRRGAHRHGVRVASPPGYGPSELDLERVAAGGRPTPSWSRPADRGGRRRRRRPHRRLGVDGPGGRGGRSRHGPSRASRSTTP